MLLTAATLSLGSVPPTRRAVLRSSGAVAAAATACALLPTTTTTTTTTTTARAAEANHCADDRCNVERLLASTHVPARLRDALRLVIRVTDGFDELTSECGGGETCTVSARVLQGEYLGARSALVSLADEGALREPAVLSLVASSDREAYARNVARFESSIRYAASCASLSQFDPEMPSFARGSYVPKGLKDANGNLLGSNLENSRDFLLDARDALVVACTFVFYTAGA